MSIIEEIQRITTTVEVRQPGVQGPPGSGGGGGTVDSVNGQTGVVVLDATDVGADATGTAATALATHVAAADPHPLYALESSLATVATTGAYADLTGKPTLGTAAPLNVAAAGDAASGEVVKGNDTRLTDARTPTNLTGPVTSVGNATAIANGAISNAMLANAAVANLSGTNTGDETGARVATLLHAASNKTSLVDADEVTGTDSAASFGLIRTTWTNVKAFLKTYFDTLYQAVLVSGTNIKTINSTSLLGSGNIAISASPGGSDTHLQFNTSSAFGGNANATINTSTGAITLAQPLTESQAVAATSTDGVILSTTATATVGAQKWSPRVRWSGSGWKTTATAGAQPVDFIAELQPVQGTTSPTSKWALSAQINGGGYTEALSVTNAGKTTIKGPLFVDYDGGGGSNQQHIILNTSGNGQTVIGGWGGRFFVREGTAGNFTFAAWLDNRTNATGIEQRSTDHLRWSSTNSATGNPDVGVERIGPGLLGFNDGSTAVWRDWKARNGILTGNLALGIVAKTANYTVTANDGVIECDATSGAITLTLPAVSGAQAGTQYTLKKTDASANAVTFDGNASETIDGATTVSTTTQHASITIIRNAAGTAWLTLKD